MIGLRRCACVSDACLRACVPACVCVCVCVCLGWGGGGTIGENEWYAVAPKDFNTSTYEQ